MHETIDLIIRLAKKIQNGLKIHPKWPQNGPSWTKRAQVVRSWLEVGPLLTLKCRMGAQDGFNMAKVGSRIASGWPNLAPICPKGAQVGAKMVSCVPKLAPRWAKWGQRRTKVGPTCFQVSFSWQQFGRKIAWRTAKQKHWKNKGKPMIC